MQYPLYTAMPLQHHTQSNSWQKGLPSSASGFLPDDTSSRDLHVLWGSEPTTHPWAGKAERTADSYEKELEKHKCACAPLPLCLVLCRSAQECPALLAFLTASSWRSCCCTEGTARQRPPLQHPHSCNHPTLLQLSNSHCFDGLKPSNNLLIREAWYFIREMKETFTGLCTPTILYHQGSLWIF